MVNLVNESKKVVFGNDSIVIQKFIAGIKGGRSLDLTGFSSKDADGKDLTYIAAGHIIITKDGTYKPMPIAAEVVEEVATGKYIYGSLPDGYSYAGILVGSISTSLPMAAIMTEGQVNSVVLPFAVPNAFKTACPLVEFIKDEASV